jgi:transcriptional regulator with XRE-family HTH domain
LKYKTYAENMRVAMKTKNNAQRRPLSIRDVATLTGKSYEHIRKLYMGNYEVQKFSVSEVTNEAICEVLGLPVDEMWWLAQQEKFSQKTGYAPLQLEDPEGRELSELWTELDHDQQVMLLTMAKSLVASAHSLAGR